MLTYPDYYPIIGLYEIQQNLDSAFTRFPDTVEALISTPNASKFFIEFNKINPPVTILPILK